MKNLKSDISMYFPEIGLKLYFKNARIKYKYIFGGRNFVLSKRLVDFKNSFRENICVGYSNNFFSPILFAKMSHFKKMF